MDGFGEVGGERWDEAPELVSPILRVVPVRTGEHAIVVLAGDVDTSTVELVRAVAEQCLQQRPQRLSIDLSSVQFCDCSGVRALRGVRADADAAGVEFRLIAPSAWIRRVFVLAEAEELLDVAVEPALEPAFDGNDELT